MTQAGMTKVGVILSGCGLLDGSNITEAVLTFLSLDRNGAEIVAIAPDVEAAQTINHYTGAETRGEAHGVLAGISGEARGVLAESARLVRGKITSTHEISAHDIDALILVGGHGAIKNLCTYANDGVNATLNSDVERLVSEVAALGKPLGAMSEATVVVALALQGRQNSSPAILTAGNDARMTLDLEALGAHHQITTVEQICIDERNHIVSTSGYLLAHGPAQAEMGINKLVEHVLSMTRELSAALGGGAAVSG